MFLIALIVFIAVFGIFMLIITAMGVGSNKEQKQILTRLESISAAAERRPEEEGIHILREELLSTIPWLNRWLYRIELFPKLRRILLQADVKWTTTGLLVAGLGSGVVAGAAAYWRTNAWPFAVLIGAAATTIPFLYVLYKRAQRFGAFEEKLPEALDLMVSALRAGHSLISALEMVVKEIPNPIADEFKKCFDEQNFGLELREAMINLAQRVPLHDVHIMVTAIVIQKESGGNLAEILEKVATIIRERFRLKRQVRVYTAQGRLTGWILALLPVILGVGLYFVNPEYMSQLWKDPRGLKLMYIASAMTLTGGLIIRKIVSIRV